jgi:hypothetical protein
MRTILKKKEVVETIRSILKFTCDRCHTVEERKTSPPLLWTEIKEISFTLAAKHLCYTCSNDYRTFMVGKPASSVTMTRRANDDKAYVESTKETYDAIAKATADTIKWKSPLAEDPLAKPGSKDWWSFVGSPGSYSDRYKQR